MDLKDLEEKAKKIAEEEENTAPSETSNAEGVNLPSEQNNAPVSLESIQQEYLRNQVKQGATLTDLSSDFAKAKITTEIITDDSEEGKKYRDELRVDQKDTLKEKFKQDKVKEKASTLNEQKKKAEAFYNGVRPILEFDFSNLIKNKSKDKNTETETKKTYEDRSYGIPLMIGMLIILTIPYFIFSILLALFNGINSIIEQIDTFGKVSKSIVLTIVLVVSIILIIYGAICGIEKLFNLDIIPM